MGLKMKKRDITEKRIKKLKEFCILEIEKVSKRESKCNLLYKKDSGIIFYDLYFYENEDLIEVIMEEANSHLKSIEEMDSNYFKGCSEKYLKGSWKRLIERIRDSIKIEEVLEHSIWD